jgi:hypothetical protein
MSKATEPRQHGRRGLHLRTHGKSYTREYRIWSKMRERCNNPNIERYPLYGGRGIKICERWNSFQSFLADMGTCPAGLSIDRIDVNKGYFKENCRWADRRTQANNTRSNRYVEHQGERITIKELSRKVGMNYATLYHRIAVHGWPLDRALAAPVLYGGAPDRAKMKGIS